MHIESASPRLLTGKIRKLVKIKTEVDNKKLRKSLSIQDRIAQLVAYRLSTGEVPGSNPGKGENFSKKISNSFIRI